MAIQQIQTLRRLNVNPQSSHVFIRRLSEQPLPHLEEWDVSWFCIESTAIQHACQFPALTALSGYFTDHANVALLERLPKLQRLHLQAGTIVPIPSDFPPFAHLTDLNCVSMGALDELGRMWLQSIPTLQVLEFSVDVHTFAWGEFNLPNLIELRVHTTNPSLEPPARMPQLKTFQIMNRSR
jgi:hypothetical protein